MIQALLNTNETTPLPEMCARLGQVLGLEKPVPQAVLLRAIDDPAFAADLITCRNAPGFLAALFDDRRTRAYAPAGAPTQASSIALAAKAAAALTRWGKAGFSTVDASTLERRESACLACPNLAAPQAAFRNLPRATQRTIAPGSASATRSACCAAASSARRSGCRRKHARPASDARKRHALG